MLVDPTQTAVDRHTQRVQRGCGFFTSRHAGRTDARREGFEGYGLDDRGLRLSLSLPCKIAGSTVE
jgi:hypothetical protein